MAKKMPIAKEAFLPSVEPAEDSTAIGHTGSKMAVTLLKNESFRSIEINRCYNFEQRPAFH